MSQPPTPFARSWSFTDFSTNNPTTPHQGQKIDLELNNVLAVLNYTISRLNEVQADDGKVRNSSLNFTTIAAAIGPILSVSIINSINSAGTTQVTAVNTAGSTQVAAVNAAGATFAATASTVSTNAAAAASSATTAEGWKNSAQASALSATNSANTAFVHKNTALSHANDAFTHSDNAASSAAAASFSLAGCISSAGQAAIEAGQANAYSVQAETSKVGALNAQSAAQSASSSASSSAISATASAVSATASASSAASSATSAYNYYSAFNLSVGTVSTGAAGSQAVVTRTGTAPSYLLNFTIPAGAAGAAGATGASGVIAATSPLSYNSGTQTVSIDLSAYATKASPTFTGTPTLPTGTIAVTQTAGNSTTAIATTAFVTAVDILKAPLASPVFTGDARCVTPATSDNDTSIATTAFVKNQAYLTASLAASTYYLQTNPSGFIQDAPSNSIQYARYNGTWAAVSGGGGGSYLPLAGGTLTGAVVVTQINNTLNTDLVIDSYNDTGAGTHYLHKFTPYDGKFNLATNGGGLVFPDGTTQTTATLTGPAGANGASGAMNYLDIVTMTATSASYYESSGTWYAYYGFINNSGGWFYNKLNAPGVTFKLYINGVYDSSTTGAYNGNTSAGGTLVTTPVSSDVITIFLFDGTSEATIPLVTYTY